MQESLTLEQRMSALDVCVRGGRGVDQDSVVPNPQEPLLVLALVEFPNISTATVFKNPTAKGRNCPSIHAGSQASFCYTEKQLILNTA